MIANHASIARALGRELGLPAIDPRRPRRRPTSVGTATAGRGTSPVRRSRSRPASSQLSEFVEVAHRNGGADAAVEVAERRSAKQFDPDLVRRFTRDVDKVFHGIDELDSWDAVVDGEPALAVRLSPERCDEALAAIARFVDLKSPYTLGHSAALGDLAARAGVELGLPAGDVQMLRRAGLVAGFGRLGVSNSIWDKPAPLTAGEWERVRMHPHLTERMLHQSAALGPIGRVAVQLRERLDGSGYPAGLTAPAISRAGQILGAADAYQSMREPRPYRAALTAAAAAAELRREARAGRMDGAVVDAVLRAAGHRPHRRRDGPADLTGREIEVLRLVARGLSNRQIGARLAISPKTAGNHVEHIYTRSPSPTAPRRRCTPCSTACSPTRTTDARACGDDASPGAIVAVPLMTARRSRRGLVRQARWDRTVLRPTRRRNSDRAIGQ